MYPTKIEAIELLKTAEKNNPGAWVQHSYAVANCAQKIAAKCNMNEDKAYILGLLHDIGRNFGVKHIAHVFDGHKFMSELGYDEVARICLTHSFSTKNINEYSGNFDLPQKDIQYITTLLENIVFDNYDKLIQLCDSLAGTEVVDMKERMNDVKRRYGKFAQNKWDMNLKLKEYFENLCGENIYVITTENRALWHL